MGSKGMVPALHVVQLVSLYWKNPTSVGTDGGCIEQQKLFPLKVGNKKAPWERPKPPVQLDTIQPFRQDLIWCITVSIKITSS